MRKKKRKRKEKQKNGAKRQNGSERNVNRILSSRFTQCATVAEVLIFNLIMWILQKQNETYISCEFDPLNSRYSLSFASCVIHRSRVFGVLHPSLRMYRGSYQSFIGVTWISSVMCGTTCTVLPRYSPLRSLRMTDWYTWARTLFSFVEEEKAYVQ